MHSLARGAASASNIDGAGWLQEAAQGSGWGRVLAGEEGSIGPRGPSSGEVGATNWQEYEQAVRVLHGGNQSFQARQFTAFVDGAEVNGTADAVTTVNGLPTAVEAKYSGNWQNSIYNPDCPVGQEPFAQGEQQRLISQAAKYASGFEGGVTYYTNSPELAAYYTQAFEEAGISNFQFVILPAC